MSGRWAAMHGWLAGHPSEFRLGLRILIAGMAAFFVADVMLGLPQSYWAVLTAVIVMQASIGGSIKASVDRIVGTLAGAVWGVVVALTVPHGSSWLLATALTLALAPLALLVAFRPVYRIAPATAIIVLLGAGPSEGPLIPAIHRVEEIIVGSLVGLVVALLVLPARVHRMLCNQSGAVLRILAEQMGQIPDRLAGTAERGAWQAAADRRRKAQDKTEELAEEAKRERRNRLTDNADPEPLARTLRRLGMDLSAIGRATDTAWEPALLEYLAGPAAEVVNATTRFFAGCADALAERGRPPSTEPLETAVTEFANVVASLRREGVTRPLAGPVIERLFGLGFACDQLRRDAGDLAERIAELAPAQ